MRTFDGVFLEFPLCVLSIKDEKWIDKIISYCIVEYAKSVKTNVRSRINRIEELPEDFDKHNIKECQIILAAEELRITIGSLKQTIYNHNELEIYINAFIGKYGKQPYCRIGKQICFEARDGMFDQMLFRVLCAIQSKLGKRKHFRIVTRDEIIRRIYGFKTKDVFDKEHDPNVKIIGIKKLKRLTDILEAKDLISKFTYARRLTYYSTRYDKQELIDKVKETKLYWMEKKMNLEDEMGTKLIKENIEAIKKKKRMKIYKMPSDELLKGKTGTT